jgi:hypothetical protein
MAKQPVPTHLNAYYTALADKQQEYAQLLGEIRALQRTIDEKRAEQGLDPLYAEQGENEKKQSVPKKQDPVPAEASGFGVKPASSGKKEGNGKK